MKKILIIKQGLKYGWYMEEYFEELIRLLGNRFFIDIADVGYPPYDLSIYPQNNPFMKNPNDYDLLVPVLGTHWHVPRDEFKHKVGIVAWEAGEGNYNPKVYAVATPEGEECFKDSISLRMGIDTERFKPLNHKRDDKLLRVGILGNLTNDRHSCKEIMKALIGIDGVRPMLFMHFWEPLEEYVLGLIGGKKALQHIEGGGKSLSSLPNIYNKFDVLLRIEKNEDYGMPVMEASACGIATIATDWGNCKAILKGRGILIDKNKKIEDKIKDMVVGIKYLRDHPIIRKRMGKQAREEIINNWTWEKHLPSWIKFFEKGLKNGS